MSVLVPALSTMLARDDLGPRAAELLGLRRARRCGAPGEAPVVGAHDVLDAALGLDAAVLEKQRAVAQHLDAREVMRDEDDRAARALEVEDAPVALLRERLVAHREDLVEQQDVGIHVHRDRESEPQEHAGGVRAHGLIGECRDLGEVQDLVDVLIDVRRSTGRRSRRSGRRSRDR